MPKDPQIPEHKLSSSWRMSNIEVVQPRWCWLSGAVLFGFESRVSHKSAVDESAPAPAAPTLRVAVTTMFRPTVHSLLTQSMISRPVSNRICWIDPKNAFNDVSTRSRNMWNRLKLFNLEQISRLGLGRK